MKAAAYILASVLMAISTTGCQNVNLEEREFTGMNKSDVVQILGEPDKVEELTKNTEFTFGPMEGLWDQIEMGDKIVIWTYETDTGYKELYFLNDSSEAAGEFFWYHDPDKNPVF
jgi:hypothetical protein